MKIHLRVLRIALLMVSSLGWLPAEEPCEFGYGSEKAADQLEAALKQAPNCEKATAILSKCWWGSSADVGFASIVLEKCEKSLLPRLAASGKSRYVRERELCAYEFAAQDGTLFLSEEAMCALDVAHRFDAKPVLAEEPAPRASFDCAKATSAMEKAICSDDKLGRADIVLQRAYRPVLRSMPAAKRPQLIAEQKAWRSQAEKKCGVGSAPLNETARVCVRKEFEARFTQLDSCSAGGPKECLDEGPNRNP